LPFSTAFQYSRTTGSFHHSVSTFHLAMGSIDPLNAPEMKAGVPSAARVTTIGVGGESNRVMMRNFENRPPFE
jgi:hypothetical protein